MRKSLFGLAAAASLALAAPASAQQTPLRVGFITILNGPLALNGREQTEGFDLALKRLGNKIGGLPIEVFREDKKMTIETAQQSISKLLEQHKIEFLFGNILSNQLLAYVPRVSQAGAITFSGIAGPSDFAGKNCNPNLFVYSWENNMPSEAVGKAMADAGMKKAFFIAQNYVTGREHVGGAKFFFKGEVAGEAYVPFTHVDYAAEIASIRASGADAVYAFLPGAGGIAFVKQFANSGLKDKVKLYGGSWLADEHSFQALGDTALGINIAAPWFADLDNPANKEFVDAFRKEYGRNPVFYAAFTYDAVNALDAAIKALKGDIKDKAALRRELEKAEFKSVRGDFSFNKNHFPVQSFYAGRVVKKGNVLMHEVGPVIFKGHKDRFSQDCTMKP